MLDIAKIREGVINDIKSRDISEAEIAEMTAEQAFIEYCNWHGLYQWGSMLINVLDMLRAADDKST